MDKNKGIEEILSPYFYPLDYTEYLLYNTNKKRAA